MLKKVLLISFLGISSFNVCNSANAVIPAAVWNYKSVNLSNSTPESITFKWDSHNPSTNSPFSFIDPIILMGVNGNMNPTIKNIPMINLINDADATVNIIASSTTTNTELCGVTFQGDGSIDVNPKSADTYRCTASISGDGIFDFTISPK